MQEQGITTTSSQEVVQHIEYSQDQLNLIKNVICKDSTNDELKLFIQHCRHTGLDPFTRQIYFMKVNGKMSVQTSIDGFRLIAERSGKYMGQKGPEWCGRDGVWRDVWLENEPPIAARVGVVRSDFSETLWAVAKYSSYVQMKDGKPNTMWSKMPDSQLAKCAEALALRRAFPRDLSGLYTSDEMGQTLNEEPKKQNIYEPKRKSEVIKQENDSFSSFEDIPHPVEITHDDFSHENETSISSDALISEPQSKRLYAIQMTNKVSKDQLRDYIFRNYGITSSSKILKKDYNDICDWIQSNGEPGTNG